MPYPIGIPPRVAEKFDELALMLAKDGFRHYSADAILHRIRWHFTVERRIGGFKCNNNWTAPLARWWMLRHPEYPKFFELRERLQDGYAKASE